MRPKACSFARARILCSLVSPIVAYFCHEIYFWLVPKTRLMSAQKPAIIQVQDQEKLNLQNLKSNLHGCPMLIRIQIPLKEGSQVVI